MIIEIDRNRFMNFRDDRCIPQNSLEIRACPFYNNPSIDNIKRLIVLFVFNWAQRRMMEWRCYSEQSELPQRLEVKSVGSNFWPPFAPREKKSPWHIPDTQFGVPHSWFRRCGKMKNKLLLSGIELGFIGYPTGNPVATLSALSPLTDIR